MKCRLLEEIFIEDTMEVLSIGTQVLVLEQVSREFIFNKNGKYADDREVKIKRFADPARWSSYYLGVAEDGTSIFIPYITKLTSQKAEEIIQKVKEIYDTDNEVVLTVRPGKKSMTGSNILPVTNDKSGDKYLVTRIAGRPINKWIGSSEARSYTTGAAVPKDIDWLQPILAAAEAQPEIEAAKITLPDMFADSLRRDAKYLAYKSKDSSNDDLVLLLSPEKNQGMYVVKNMLTIGSPETGEPKPFHKAINDFAQQNPEAGRLDLRNVLRNSKEGIFFRRDYYSDYLAKKLMTAVALDDYELAHQVLRQDPASENIIKVVVALKENKITTRHYLLL